MLGAATVPAIGKHDDALARMRVTLEDEPPYHFVLAYEGPRIEFRGLVCYRFAGYNETCTDPFITWLTPAVSLRLMAPGGVPRELLAGYDVYVRYPALSTTTFRYALAERP